MEPFDPALVPGLLAEALGDARGGAHRALAADRRRLDRAGAQGGAGRRDGARRDGGGQDPAARDQAALPRRSRELLCRRARSPSASCRRPAPAAADRCRRRRSTARRGSSSTCGSRRRRSRSSRGNIEKDEGFVIPDVSLGPHRRDRADDQLDRRHPDPRHRGARCGRARPQGAGAEPAAELPPARHPRRLLPCRHASGQPLRRPQDRRHRRRRFRHHGPHHAQGAAVPRRHRLRLHHPQLPR